MSEMKSAPQDCVIVGYELYPTDIDSFMWDDFKEFPKCSRCGCRTDFFASNPNYRLAPSGPDFGATWDGEIIVTERFREFCQTNNLNGLVYRSLRRDVRHFHIIPKRVLAVNVQRSHFKTVDVCKGCGFPREVITLGNPMVIQIDVPMLQGFYRSNILLGSGNDKSPALIVDFRTKKLLEDSDLKGFHDFEPVYAPRTPALEHAGKNHSAESVKRKKLPSKSPAPDPLDPKPFIRLLAHPSPAFRCRLPRDDEATAIIPITHNVADPPADADLKKARQLLGAAGKQVLEFYRYNDGVELHRDTNSDESGVRLFPIKQWEKETKAMKAAFKAMHKDERPDIIDRTIAIGEVPNSGHHFLLVTKGWEVGSILLTNHESLSADEFAPDFNTFLKTICTDPADLLVNTLGNYVRYRDGKTDKQWIPIEYLPDKGERSKRRKR